MEAAITKFGSPHLKALLEATQLDAHPEIRRMFAKVGRLTKEDSAAWKALGKARAEAGDHIGSLGAYEQGILVAEAKGDIQAAKEMTVFAKRIRKALEP